MAVCGCGQSLVGAPPIIDGGLGEDQGIIVSGAFDNTIITASGATAWRPLTPAQVVLFNFTLGDGEMDARYLADGYNIDAIVSFRFGSTSTFAAVPWNVVLPFTPQSVSGATGVINNHGILGTWSTFDASAGSPWRDGEVFRTSAGALGFRSGDDLAGSNAAVQQGTPITFVAGDEFSFQVRFEATTN